jgi:uncharacterized membrane protein YeaQ/YmgE (transglycosylase-associated protein family)
MDIVFTVILGFVAGLVAQVMTPGIRPFGVFATAVLGVAGAIAATVVGHLIGWYEPGQTAGFVGALIGALVLVTGYRLLSKGHTVRRSARIRKDTPISYGESSSGRY